jgi:hypothetical protein
MLLTALLTFFFKVVLLSSLEPIVFYETQHYR